MGVELNCRSSGHPGGAGPRPGLSLQAWVNPYRLMTDAQMAQIPERYAIRRWFGDPAFMVQEGAYWYLNPGNAQVQALILDGVRELVVRYDVDGVQIDDSLFLCPPPLASAITRPRPGLYLRHGAGHVPDHQIRAPHRAFRRQPGGQLWPGPRLGPDPVYRPGNLVHHAGVHGLCGPANLLVLRGPTGPFETVLRAWEALCANGPVALVVGLAAYRFAGSQTLRDQVTRVERSPVARGYIYFRYEHLAPL